MFLLTRFSGKYIKKIFLFFFAFLLLGSMGTYVLLQTGTGKKWAGNTLGYFLERQLQTPVSIEELHLHHTGKINVRGLTIYDHKKQPLLETEHLSLTYVRYHPFSGNFSIANAELYAPVWSGRKYAEDSVYNYTALYQKLSGDEKGSSTGRSIEIHRFNVREGTIKNIDENIIPQEGFFQAGAIKSSNLNIEISNFRANPGGLKSRIDFLQFKDRSGLEINHLQTQLNLNGDRLSLLNFLLVSGNSRIDGKLVATLRDEEGDNENEWDATFRHLELAPEDLQVFWETPIKIRETITFKGDVKRARGSALRLQDMQIWFGEETQLTGNYRIANLDELTESFFDWEIEDGMINYEDVANFYPDFAYLDELKRLQQVELQGRITGFSKDFVAFGTFNTPVGKASTDLNIMAADDPYKLKYSGELELINFETSAFLGDNAPHTGRISFTSKVNGRGIDPEHIIADFSSHVQQLEWRDYAYQNIKAEGHLNRQLFEGSFELDDPNAYATFAGSVNFNNPEPLLDFNANIENARLKTLNLSDNDVSLSSEANINLSGFDPEHTNGIVRFRHGKLISAGEQYDFDSMLVEVSMEETGEKRLSVYSDMMYADVSGRFIFSDLPDMLLHSLSGYINPRILPEPGQSLNEMGEQDIAIDLRVHNTDFLTRLFMPTLAIGQNTFLEASVNTYEPAIRVNGHIPGLSYEDLFAEDLIVEADGHGQWLNIISSTGKISRNGNELLDQWIANTRAMKDSLHFDAEIDNRENQQALSLEGWWKFEADQSYLELLESHIVMDNTQWDISAEKMTYFPEEKIEIPELVLSRGIQKATFSTSIDEKLSYPVNVSLENVAWTNLHPFLTGFLKNFRGTTNGQVAIYNILDVPEIYGRLDLQPASFLDEPIGGAYVESNFDRFRGVNNITTGILNDHGREIARGSGTIDLTGKRTTNMNMIFTALPARYLSSFFEGNASELTGEISGFARVFGPFSDVSMNANLDILNGGFRVDYLQTYYTFSESIQLTDSTIQVNNVTLNDNRGNTAQINGIIEHDLFRDMYLDLRLNGNNFHALNTTERDNSLYYGTGYATGTVTFDGHINDLLITMQLRTERNTRLTIPNQSSGDAGKQHQFIRFTGTGTEREERAITTFNPSNMELHMDFEFTPDAEIQLHFDAFGKDVLRARGDGNLRMDYTYAGDFTIYGDYTISEGEYLFTLMELIRKRFTVEQGGTLRWTGDPLNAEMDLTANYRQRVQTAELMPAAMDGTSPEERPTSSTRVPVLVKAHLTGSLLTPEIRLDLEAEEYPTTTELSDLNLQSAIQRIRADEQELQQQIISLLVFNRFLPRGESQNLFYAGVGAGIGELVSAQMSGWLSGISDDLHMNVNYRGADGIYDRELEVTGSTRLLDDRLGIYGTYDFEDASSGALEVNYRLTESGRYEVKAFRRNNRSLRLEERGDEIWGFGLSFRKQFDNLSELFQSQTESPAPIVPEDTTEHAREEVEDEALSQ